MTPMKKRATAAQACIDRFRGRAYEPGKADCVQLARHCLHHLGRRVGQGKLPAYSTEIGGLRALKRLGFGSLVEALDGFGLERIAPASALPGDLIALPTEHPLGALAVAVGNGRVIGFLEGEKGAVIMQPHAFVAAWRTL